MNIFECYGHGETGTAIVAAVSREMAIQACREWLGWDVCVAFRASEWYTLWQNAGGSDATPVMYAADGKRYEVLILRRCG